MFDRSVWVGGGKNFAARISGFAWLSSTGGLWSVALSGESWGGALIRAVSLRAHLASRQRPFRFASELASATNSLHAVVLSLRICILSWLRRRLYRASSSRCPVAV